MSSRRQQILRAAAAVYLLTVARPQYEDFVSVCRLSRLSPAERQVLYRLAWTEWSDDPRARQEAWYAIRSLRESWFSLALDLMPTGNPVDFSDCLEGLHRAFEKDTYLRLPLARAYLTPFEPWPRRMDPYRPPNRREQQMPRLPRWTARAADEFKRVMEQTVHAQQFLDALKEA